MKKVVLIVVFIFFASSILFGQELQYRSKYPDIPIVDVHSHAREIRHAENLIKVSEIIKEKYDSNLAFWISLDIDRVTNPTEMKAAANNRMLFAVRGRGTTQTRPHNAYEEHVKNNFYVEEVIRRVQNDGYVGLKIWFGPHNLGRNMMSQTVTNNLDDPVFAQIFSRLEEENVLLTSPHVAESNGRHSDRYLRVFSNNNPVWFWEQIRAFENVVAKYPNLTIVVAHAAFLLAQDAQVDYLRYMLSRYPNLYVDISSTDFHLYHSSRDNLRDFFIEYQDRILFGLDDGAVSESRIEFVVDWYVRFFAFLETDQIVNLGYFREIPIKGLDLPREVLEKIYYKNALKLYPGLREAMGL